MFPSLAATAFKENSWSNQRAGPAGSCESGGTRSLLRQPFSLSEVCNNAQRVILASREVSIDFRASRTHTSLKNLHAISHLIEK